MIPLVVILALTLGGVALSTGVAIAIGRVGAAADADLDRLLDERRRGPSITVLRRAMLGWLGPSRSSRASIRSPHRCRGGAPIGARRPVRGPRAACVFPRARGREAPLFIPASRVGRVGVERVDGRGQVMDDDIARARQQGALPARGSSGSAPWRSACAALPRSSTRPAAQTRPGHRLREHES